MSCWNCEDGLSGVEDREALVEFIDALLAGDVALARIMAGRAFTWSDQTIVENALARARAVRVPG